MDVQWTSDFQISSGRQKAVSSTPRRKVSRWRADQAARLLQGTKSRDCQPEERTRSGSVWRRCSVNRYALEGIVQAQTTIRYVRRSE